MVPKIQDRATLSRRSHVTCLDRRVDEDVVVEGVAAEGEEDLVPPATIGGGRGVEEDGDQGPDVLDAGGLEVELGDHGVGRVVPGSRTSGRGLVGGRDAVLGVDGQAGGDAEVLKIQARAATRTRSWAAEASDLAARSAAARAASAC